MMRRSPYNEPTTYPDLVDAAERGCLLDVACVQTLEQISSIALAGADAADRRLHSGIRLGAEEATHLAAVVAVGELVAWCGQDREIVDAYLCASQASQMAATDLPDLELMSDMDDMPAAVAYRW